ncbi:MAG: hypothetical protein Ct9H90mP16_21680 [Candidatus Poseidoniales archaeon]|nr:MAG: hypothetical protein Ct9H90mP16_21680 [Candidatus Poseidoniales archaeon]
MCAWNASRPPTAERIGAKHGRPRPNLWVLDVGSRKMRLVAAAISFRRPTQLSKCLSCTRPTPHGISKAGIGPKRLSIFSRTPVINEGRYSLDEALTRGDDRSPVSTHSHVFAWEERECGDVPE